MKTTKLLRPNPNVEEDLERATAVDSAMRERIRTYTKRVGKEKLPCSCNEVVKNAGPAPLLKLNSGRYMPGFGIGTWLGFTKSGGHVTVGEDVVENAIMSAVTAGYRHIDTAHIYNTEVEVGRAVNWLMDDGIVKRKDLFITTKLWNNAHARSAVVPALRESLRRLQLDYVDLYLIHWPIGQHDGGKYDNTDYLETWKGMMDARDFGLTKSIGVSNFNQHMLDRIVSLSPVKPAVLQVEINLNIQQPELIKYCREQDIQVVGYTPFGSLFYHKASRNAPRPRVDNLDLEDIAWKYHKTVPQIVLRFLLELGVTPIPKSLARTHIFENIDIFDFHLDQKERDFLRTYDRNYRTIAGMQWYDHINYPFEKPREQRFYS